MLQFLIDYLFPKNDNIVEIERLTAYEIAERAKPAPHIPQDFIRSIFSYKDKLIKDCLWEIKYKNNQKIAETFAPLILDKIIETLSEYAMFNEREKPIITTIPPSKNRKTQKGFDQEKIILDALSKLDTNKSFEIKYDILERIKDTKQQSLLHNKLERLENMHNVFRVKSPDLIKEKVVIIVDDITTTGATLVDARRALEESGSRMVYGVTIAH